MAQPVFAGLICSLLLACSASEGASNHVSDAGPSDAKGGASSDGASGSGGTTASGGSGGTSTGGGSGGTMTSGGTGGTMTSGGTGGTTATGGTGGFKYCGVACQDCACPTDDCTKCCAQKGKVDQCTQGVCGCF